MADSPHNLTDAARIQALEERVAELTSRIAGLVSQVELLTSLGQAGAPVGSNAAAPGEGGLLLEDEISPGMISVISMIQRGEGDKAQQALYALPEAELASQPGAVALVAAALFVQRGDFAAGHKALQQVRQLTSDPRLLLLMTRLEEQIAQ